jgi:hypothetical protein
MKVRHVLRTVWVLTTTREVVNYHADDCEYGRVEIEVRANRVTGRRRRYVWSRDDPNA